MKCFAIVVGVVPALALAATPLVPVAGGPVTANSVLINGSSGDQYDPHLSGDLAAYSNRGLPIWTIRYFDFLTNTDSAIPAIPPAVWADQLSDVSNGRISFSRVLSDRTACMVFDVTTATLNEIAPAIGTSRFGTALGANTVAFVEGASGNGDIFVADLPSGVPLNLSASLETEEDPAMAPSGNAAVWVRLSGATGADIMKAIRSVGVWGAASVVSSTIDHELNPDTDGTTIVYDANVTGSTTGWDIYLVPQSGGTAMQLVLSGNQHNPSISSGVIGFVSRSPSSSPGDLFIYVIATNTVYQVTNTTADEALNDVTVLSNGSIRIVWEANDGATGDYNVHGATFTVPLSNAPPPIFSFTGFFQPVDNLPTFNSVKAGSAVPVKFSLGGDFGLNIFAPGYPASVQIACDTMALDDEIESTATAGGSSLSYDPSTGQYSYVWKTDRSWAGTCRQLTVKLADGSSHSANFAFKK